MKRTVNVIILLCFMTTWGVPLDTYSSVALSDPGDDSIIQVKGDLIESLTGSFSATFQGSDIADVIAMFATQTGISIIVDPDVDGTVSAIYEKADIRAALLSILAMTDLYYLKEDGIVRIVTVDEYVSELIKTHLVTKSYDTELIDLENVSTVIKPLLTPSVGSMLLDANSSRIIITDVEDNFDKIEAMIDEIARYPLQVEIETQIVQIDLQEGYKLGVDWSVLDIGKTVDTTMNFSPDSGVADEVFNVTATHVFGEAGVTLQGLISAVMEDYDVKVMSKPKILTSNREEAWIHIGSKVPYVSSVTENASTGQTTSSVEFVDVGIKIIVTPVITEDGLVHMTIEANSSSYQMEAVTSTENAPRIITTELECQAMVNDGDTIIIGGLIQETVTEDVKSVPILGQIPILKYLFSHTVDSTERTELAIFITPRIIEAGKSNLADSGNTEALYEFAGHTNS